MRLRKKYVVKLYHTNRWFATFQKRILNRNCTCAFLPQTKGPIFNAASRHHGAFWIYVSPKRTPKICHIHTFCTLDVISLVNANARRISLPARSFSFVIKQGAVLCHLLLKVLLVSIQRCHSSKECRSEHNNHGEFLARRHHVQRACANVTYLKSARRSGRCAVCVVVGGGR